MQVNLSIEQWHTDIPREQMLLGGPKVALHAHIQKPITVAPGRAVRIPTPIGFTGNGHTIALMDIRAGRLASYVPAKPDELVRSTGQYFLPAPDQEHVVDVDVINETPATLIIHPGQPLGILTFIDIAGQSTSNPVGNDGEGVEPGATSCL